MKNIEGKYSFKIWKEKDQYIAKCTILYDVEIETFHTIGDTKEEIFEMIADGYMTSLEIKVSIWSKFWHKLLRLQ